MGIYISVGEKGAVSFLYRYLSLRERRGALSFLYGYLYLCGREGGCILSL
jgi:hypothetical protein